MKRSTVQGKSHIDRVIMDTPTVGDDCSLHKGFVYAFACCSRPIVQSILEGIDPSSTRFGGDCPHKGDRRESQVTHCLRSFCDVGDKELCYGVEAMVIKWGERKWFHPLIRSNSEVRYFRRPSLV